MLLLYYFLGPHPILAFYLFFPTFSLLIIMLSLKFFNNFLILFIFIIWLYTYTTCYIYIYIYNTRIWIYGLINEF